MFLFRVPASHWWVTGLVKINSTRFLAKSPPHWEGYRNEQIIELCLWPICVTIKKNSWELDDSKRPPIAPLLTPKKKPANDKNTKLTKLTKRQIFGNAYKTPNIQQISEPNPLLKSLLRCGLCFKFAENFWIRVPKSCGKD